MCWEGRRGVALFLTHMRMVVSQAGSGPQQNSGFGMLGVNRLEMHIERQIQEGGIEEASCGCEGQ